MLIGGQADPSSVRRRGVRTPIGASRNSSQSFAFHFNKLSDAVFGFFTKDSLVYKIGLFFLRIETFAHKDQTFHLYSFDILSVLKNLRTHYRVEVLVFFAGFLHYL